MSGPRWRPQAFPDTKIMHSISPVNDTIGVRVDLCLGPDALSERVIGGVPFNACLLRSPVVSLFNVYHLPGGDPGDIHFSLSHINWDMTD